MRERLAIARSRSNYAVCIVEARSDVVGVWLMRYIDNQDVLSGRYAAKRLASVAARQCGVDPRLARRDVRAVMRYLWDSRCLPCGGRRYVIHSESGVSRSCQACDATGYSGAFNGTPLAQSILIDAKTRIGRALASARASSGAK